MDLLRRTGHDIVLCATLIPRAFVRHSVPTFLLGVAALVPLGIELLFVLRGVLYGLIDWGPYDNSWGGPTLPGAWAVHLLVSLPFAAAAAAALVGIATVQRHLPGRRAVVLAALLPLPAIALFIAWLQQI